MKLTSLISLDVTLLVIKWEKMSIYLQIDQDVVKNLFDKLVKLLCLELGRFYLTNMTNESYHDTITVI